MHNGLPLCTSSANSASTLHQNQGFFRAMAVHVSQKRTELVSQRRNTPLTHHFGEPGAGLAYTAPGIGL